MRRVAWIFLLVACWGSAAVAGEGVLGRLPVTFAGVLPCASCPGVRTAIRLEASGEYARRQVYLEATVAGDALREESGRWTVDSDGITLILSDGAGVRARFEVESPDRLRMLDIEGRPINSQLPYSLDRVGTPGQVVAEAPAEAWRPLDPENALYLDLEGGQVVIELAPDFAPHNVAQVRALTRQGFYDGLTFYRVIEGFVAQFGDRLGESEDPTIKRSLPAEFERSLEGSPRFTPLGAGEGYAAETGYAQGFPVARDVETHRLWMVNCTGAVQMARGNEPESGATEIAIMLGHQRRYLDRNISMLGRVVQGLDLLQKLERGNPQQGGVVADPERRDRILRARIAADLPAEERTPLEVMRTDSAAFYALIESRRNRPEEWFVHWADHIDVCAIPVPVR